MFSWFHFHCSLEFERNTFVDSRFSVRIFNDDERQSLTVMGIFIRSALCKFEVPILGCDDALCPVAIGQSGDCTPTGNSAELRAWCEHGWAPHFASYGLPIPCSAADGFLMMRLIGCAEIIGYSLMWVRGCERIGAGILMAIMIGALHFHTIHLGDTPDKLGLQLTLLVLSTFVFLTAESDTRRAVASKSKQK